MSEMGDTFKAMKEETRKFNNSRKHRLLRYMPKIKNFCSEHGITIKTIPHGFQFKCNGKVLSWWPSRNTVYDQTKGCHIDALGTPGNPKILQALRSWRDE